MKKCFLFILFVAAMITRLQAQVVTTSPLFPVDGGAVTVYFHADQGNKGLLNYETGGVFIYTGCVVAGTAGWTHVVTTWGSGNVAYRMTRIDSNTYSYTIPNIRTFYGVTGTTQIDSLCLLFTDSLGVLSGRGVGGADIFYPVIQPGVFTSNFFTPVQMPSIVAPGGTLTSLYGCSQTANISIYHNGTLTATYPSADSADLTFTSSPAGVNWIKAVANNGATTIADSFYYLQVSPPSTLPLPAGTKDGINYIDDSTVTLVLVAPGKNYVFVNGEFNAWTLDTSLNMHHTPDGSRWWITITHLTPGHQYGYQYIVDGSITIADPYAEEILDPNNDPYITASVYPGLKGYPVGLTSGYVSVLQTAKPAYTWKATSYVKPNEHNLVVYELLVRDFLVTHNYHDLIDSLSYLKNLGINAIELMPVSEFEGNISWGYNGDFFFAPDKYYGPADSLKSFIDACHSMNIAVIQDMAMNDVFGSSPLNQLYWDAANSWPSASNPWVNTDCDPATPGYQGKHPDNVGYDFNHESPYTKKMFADVIRHWVTDYHMDGYRFDLAKGYTQTFTTDVSVWGNYDASRINIWKGYADSMWATDPTTYMILEYFADNSEETVLANYGLMMWGNMSNTYEQMGMGYATSSADASGISYHNLGWTWPNLVGYMESHDEERVMYKIEKYGNNNGGTYDVKNLDTGLNRLKLNAAFFFTIPGPKMIWQFEELGYDTSQTADGGNTSPKPFLWSYENVPARASVYNVYRQLIYLKTQYPAAFNTSSFIANIGNYNLRSIYLNDPSMQAVVIGNFDVNSATTGVVFQHTGWWYEYFTGDSIQVMTLPTTSSPYNIDLNAGEYRLYTSTRIAPPPPISLGTPIVNKNVNGDVHLFQNYPNPFSGTSTVDFSLPQAMRARIVIYDITGKEMDIVTDKEYNAGTYTFNLSGAKFTTGLYYLVLTTSDGSKQTITVSVVK
jgi:1,4-alpha-glucan branching enzyme